MKRLVDLCDPARPIEGITIDVEGHEAQAIEGARETLEAHEPWILIEFNTQLAGTRVLAAWDVHRLLGERRYRPYLPTDIHADSSDVLPDSWQAITNYLNLFYSTVPPSTFLDRPETHTNGDGLRLGLPDPPGGPGRPEDDVGCGKTWQDPRRDNER